MLTIELKLNGKLIGGAQITNVSNLADLSDYEVLAVEKAAPDLGVETDMKEIFKIGQHNRNQTVWALVERVARRALDRRRGFGK